MKRLIIIILFISSMICTPVIAKGEMKRYQIKSGKAKFITKSSGSMGVHSGEENVAWDKFGALERRDSTYKMKMMGMNQTNKSTFIIDGEWSYSIDEQNKVTKIKYMDLINPEGKRGKNRPRMFDEKLIEQSGGKKIGKKTILNRQCNNYKMPSENMQGGDVEVCIYKGVALLVAMNYMGMTNTIEAVEFEENANVSKVDFSLPKGAEVVDATDMMEKYRALTNTPEMKEARKAMRAQQIQRENLPPEDYNAPSSQDLESIKKLNESLEGSNDIDAADAVSKALSIFGGRNN